MKGRLPGLPPILRKAVVLDKDSLVGFKVNLLLGDANLNLLVSWHLSVLVWYRQVSISPSKLLLTFLDWCL